MTSIYQLRITLRHIEPPIWRQVLVPGTISLARLHDVIQLAMGWTNSHLHDFVLRGPRETFSRTELKLAEKDPRRMIELRARQRGERTFLSRLELQDESDSNAEDEEAHTLAELCPEIGNHLTYTYDYGDSWEHDIVVERVRPTRPGARLPACSGGVRACPPEDCGGPFGYERLLRVLADPTDQMHRDMLDWVGGAFDPESCDIDDINEGLATLGLE